MKYASLYVMLIVASIMLSTANLPYNNAYAQREDTSKLSLFIVPPKVPADGDSYKIIYVAVMDSQNNPKTVASKLEVRLSSSTTSVGTVDNVAFIEAGGYYTVATFRSTENAGTTTISATASGYASAETTITTVKSSDRNPTKLNVIALPSPILPLQGSEGIVIVQLLNSFGSPVVAMEDTKVAITSSNENVIKVDPSVTIPKDQIYAIAKFRTSFGSGQSTITAAADNLISGITSVSTAGSIASTLKLYPIPPIISTTGIEGSWVVVQLEDSRGVPVRSSTDVEVSLLSSDDRILVPKEPSVVIRKGQSIAVAKMVPGGKEGTASVTPLATGFLSVSGSINAVKPSFEPEQRQLVIYTAPPNPDPTASDKVIVVVQIQGKSNAPAPSSRTVRIQVSSSNTDLGKLSDNLVISANDSFGIASFDFAGLPGATTIIASAANFQTKQVQITMGGTAGSMLDLIPTSLTVAAYGAPYPAFLAMLKSDAGPLRAPADINVFLTSSTPELASVPSVVKIEKGSSFAIVNITPTGFPGTLTLTATAEGFQQSVKAVTLNEFNPSTIAIFTTFPTLVQSSSEGEELVIVQLQNRKLEPEKNILSDTKLSLSLSPNSIGIVQQDLVIPKGANFAAAKIFLNSVQGDGTVTAAAEGYKLVSTRFKTIALPLDVKLTLEPQLIGINQTATLIATVTSQGNPVAGAKINWVNDERVSVLMGTSEGTDAAGQAKAVYISRQDVSQEISASVAKPGYISKEATLKLDIGDKKPTSGLGARGSIFSMDTLSIILVSAIAAEGFVIYRFYQKKKPLF
jgi:hypothetical protein